MCRGGGPRAQGLVRAGVVPTTPRSLERARREISHLSVVLCRPGIFKIAKKNFGDKILAIFCSWNGVWGEPGFVRPSVVRVPKTRIFRIAKKGQVAKKNETADDGGGSVRRAQRPATPAHAQGPRRQLPNMA